MSVIKVMDEILANKIAAGEVVERCSSVVKELVENSIDANSTEIKVELLESGIKEIKVIDNGCGMDKEDAVTCFSRHASSKVYDEDDLYHIHTLGFRGEALASIASVSKVDLYTCKEEVGTHVSITGGKINIVEPSEARIGTIISVKDLFYNTPARLKHLKSLYTELSNITDYINKIALAHPEIRFIVTNDGKELLKTDGSSNLLKCIKNVFGINTAKKMLDISGENSEYEISGYISLPEIYKTSRNSMITVVNGRVVKNIELNRAINDAYHSYKPDNYYPIVVLNINVDTSLVDVNIHPTKMDIKFGNIEDLLSLVKDTIKERISKKTLIPHIEEKPTNIKENIYEEIKLDFDVPNVSDTVTDYTINDSLVDVKDEIELHDDIDEKMPTMYAVGIVHGTYIICQNELGMYILDQHACKERVNYELVKNRLNDTKIEMEQMLLPITIEYTNSEFIILKENFEFLRNLGFDIDEFGINSVLIKAHPIWISNRFYKEDAIKSVLDIVINKEKNFDINKFNDHVAATMACKMSIKANTAITLEEAENLIEDLKKCNNPFNCPHGRPTIIYYSKGDLEKLFKRSGF